MPNDHIKVLLIEDNPGDVRLIWEILSEVRKSSFYLSVADSLLNGLKEIEKDRPHVILLDLSLGDSNGIYTLNRVRDKAKDIPIVILTGMDDEMTAIKALKEGAQDYLVKGRTDSDLLKKAIIYSIERFRLIAELEDKRSKLEEQDKVKYNYTLMIFHELLIPATLIKSGISMAERYNADNESSAAGRRTDIYSIVKSNIQNIFSLLDDLVNVSETESGSFAIKREKTVMAPFLDRIVTDTKAYGMDKKISITLNAQDPMPDVILDSRRIMQAVDNLIINSVRFSGVDSAITVTAGIKRINDIVVPEYVKHSYPPDREYLIISVKDEGTGITDELRSAVFEPFFSSTKTVPNNSKGIGLGLIIAKNIISAHGGCMWVTSGGDNKGSVFSIILPAA
jgi:signal transduction histidine kinase